MKTILATRTASISELKKSPAQIIKEAKDEAVAILVHNVPSAYLVPSNLYKKMLDIIEDYYLSKGVNNTLKSKEKPMREGLNEL